LTVGETVVIRGAEPLTEGAALRIVSATPRDSTARKEKGEKIG
jgi:hypothetical protein